MNTLINGLNRGLGFAIPSNLVSEIGQQLIAGHKIIRPWLGIRIETLGDDSSIRELFKGWTKVWSCARSRPTHRLIKAISGRLT
jgi:S1-C subfamily serine protease